MNTDILEIYNLLQEIAWSFGNKGFEEKCCEDLSFIEYMALKTAMQDKTFSIQDLGNALNFTKSGATRIVDRLENKGYLIRERSAEDGRVCCVSVTQKGIDVIGKISEQYCTYLERIFKDLEPKTIESTKNVLEALTNLIRQPDCS
jgi:DNA-binding MarR family transcriptional regulator